MLESLKEQVWKANLDLVKEGLVIKTFGNASGIDRSSGCFVIKPSGVNYEVLKPSDMVVVSLETGKVVEGKYRPSSDTPTHRDCISPFPKLAAWFIHTASLQQHGLRLNERYPFWGLHTQIMLMGQFRAHVR